MSWQEIDQAWLPIMPDITAGWPIMSEAPNTDPPESDKHWTWVRGIQWVWRYKAYANNGDFQ